MEALNEKDDLVQQHVVATLWPPVYNAATASVTFYNANYQLKALFVHDGMRYSRIQRILSEHPTGSIS